MPGRGRGSIIFYDANPDRIVDVVMRGMPKSPRRLKIELAVREYARRDKVAAEVLAEVDQARLSQVVPVLERSTNEPSEALALSLFAMVVGGQLLLSGPTFHTPSMVQAMDRLIDMLVHGLRSATQKGGAGQGEP